MQYIVGANCFAPKMYCLEFAVGKKSRKTSPSGENNHFFKYIVSYCRSWMHKETIRKEIFLRENFISQVGKLTYTGTLIFFKEFIVWSEFACQQNVNEYVRVFE
jgi:hypothetical protein